MVNYWLEDFRNEPTEEGKFQIIWKVAHLETHNSVSKEALLEMLRYMADYMLEEVKEMSETQKTENVNEFVICGRLPSLNDYTRACRSHWSKGAKMKRQVEEDIAWHILAARGAHKLRPVHGPVSLAIEWHESDRRRDLDNIVSAKKFILDAMQKTGIIPNDDRDHIRAISEEIVDDKKGFVVVRLYDVID